MPVEVVREPVGKTVLKNSGTNQNILVLFQNFLIKWQSSAFVLKILEHNKTFLFCFKVFRLHRNVRLRFKRFWYSSKRYDFDSKFLD